MAGPLRSRPVISPDECPGRIIRPVKKEWRASCHSGKLVTYSCVALAERDGMNQAGAKQKGATLFSLRCCVYRPNRWATRRVRACVWAPLQALPNPERACVRATHVTECIIITRWCITRNGRRRKREGRVVGIDENRGDDRARSFKEIAHAREMKPNPAPRAGSDVTRRV